MSTVLLQWSLKVSAALPPETEDRETVTRMLGTWDQEEGRRDYSASRKWVTEDLCASETLNDRQKRLICSTESATEWMMDVE